MVTAVPSSVTADDLAAWPLERGRGYTTASVDAFRDAAASALAQAAEHAEALAFTLAHTQAEAAGGRPRVDVAMLVRQMTPAQLRSAGIEAVGRALVDAEEQAALIVAKGRAAAARAHQEAAQLIGLTIEALDHGSKAGYEARTLRAQLVRVLSALDPPAHSPLPERGQNARPRSPA